MSIEPVNDAGYIDSAMLFSAPSESGENRQQLLLANEVFDTSGETTTKICCMPDGCDRFSLLPDDHFAASRSFGSMLSVYKIVPGSTVRVASLKLPPDSVGSISMSSNITSLSSGPESNDLLVVCGANVFLLKVNGLHDDGASVSISTTKHFATSELQRTVMVAPSALRMDELQAELCTHGLKKSGSKAELMARALAEIPGATGGCIPQVQKLIPSSGGYGSFSVGSALLWQSATSANPVAILGSVSTLVFVELGDSVTVKQVVDTGCGGPNELAIWHPSNGSGPRLVCGGQANGISVLALENNAAVLERTWHTYANYIRICIRYTYAYVCKLHATH